MISKRWIVRRSAFPFGSPGTAIGVISAADRTVALSLAESVYGASITVEPETAAAAKGGSDIGPSRVEQLMSRSAMRAMTPIEVQMARAVGVIRIPTQRYRGTIRRLHAESFKPAPEISDDLAAQLRSIVRTCSSMLPIEIVEAVGDMP